MPTTEAELRAELAACYRLFDWLGWTELIFNHITVRLPGGAGLSVLVLEGYNSRETGTALVLVTHNAAHAQKTNRQLFLREGKLSHG